MDLAGKTVLVTGGSRGIGRATCVALARGRARVAVNYVKHDDEAADTLELIKKAGGEGFVVQGDVAEIHDATRMLKQTVERMGTIDILINNAAVISYKAVEEEKIRRLHRILDVNVKGMVNMTYAAIPYMKVQPDGGVIVNISSDAGKTGYAGMAVYSASKFAVLGFTQAVADEVKEYNIRVYAVCPGTTATDMSGGTGMDPEKVADHIVSTAQEKLGLNPGEDTEIYH
jgi:3-oxoacyl-[acyl-carrier protein] reductase